MDVLSRSLPADSRPPSPADPLGDPLRALVGGGVIAVVTGVEGAHYRNPGTFMAFPAGGGAVGQVSSGCIEADLALHAARAAADGRPRRLRYGKGSPFRDLTLPCGGGLDVALVPVPDPAPIRQAVDRRAARQASGLVLDLGRGGATLSDDGGGTGPAGQQGFRIRITPPPQFLTAGTGSEVLTFAALAAAAGYPVGMATPDSVTAEAAARRGLAVRPLGTGAVLPGVPDPWTAVVLFFHDHDLEPPLLAAALRSPAFYVGAQGSLRAHQGRLAALRDLGVGTAEAARLKGPIGVIHSARDPHVLAVSVLAEILAEAPR